jgi:hypothetical protein
MQPSEISPEFLRVLASLAKLVILSMLLERALVLVFEYRWYEKLNGFGLKVPITLFVSWVICSYYKFDVLGALFEPDKTTSMGVFLTAAVAAGGSAGAITLFQNVFKFSKEAQDRLKETYNLQKEAQKADARRKLAESKAAADSAESKIPRSGG